jgi:glycosyltransferase involved in cell wall biosynthesis
MTPARAPSTTPRPSVLVLVTEDWFAVSHFLPLLRALVALGLDVTVATRCAGKEHLIAATGVQVVPFDYKRGRLDPLADAGVVVRLRRLIRQLRPGALHAIAMKPIVLGALAAAAGTRVPVVMHLTGVGLAGTSAALRTGLVHGAVMNLIGRRLNSPNARLLIENPDDRSRFARPGEARYGRITLLGGAGIDAEAYPGLAEPAAAAVQAAFVGRMVWTKGVDILVAAHGLARAGGNAITLRLCGAPDAENPRTIDAATLAGWAARPGVAWHGYVLDVRTVWRDAHIAVVPSRGGEGLPKALLEAASCGRPLVVTDVPGCRHFVRDGVEGLIVPPEDPVALANAIVRLARDPELRRRMGAAARARVMAGFTERHLQSDVQAAYRGLLNLGPRVG